MKEYISLQRTAGMVGMAQHLPAIMEETALAARVRDETCPKCHGKRIVRLKNMKFGDCPKCDGTGTLRLEGDPERLKLVFNTFGLTQPAGSATVNTNVQVNVGQSMEDLSKDVQGILEGQVVSK